MGGVLVCAEFPLIIANHVKEYEPPIDPKILEIIGNVSIASAVLVAVAGTIMLKRQSNRFNIRRKDTTDSEIKETEDV